MQTVFVENVSQATVKETVVVRLTSLLQGTTLLVVDKSDES